MRAAVHGTAAGRGCCTHALERGREELLGACLLEKQVDLSLLLLLLLLLLLMPLLLLTPYQGWCWCWQREMVELLLNLASWLLRRC